MLIVDNNDRVLIMHRSNNVRSAKNVWSIPTGEHEIGETIQTCAFRELYEEYGLVGQSLKPLHQYENIAGDEEPPHYHWVITIYKIFVEDVTKAINKEPDKHDEMLFPHFYHLSEDFIDRHPFHKSLHKIIRDNISEWLGNIV